MANMDGFYISQLQDPDANPYGTVQFFIPKVEGLKSDETNPPEGNTLTFAMTNDFTLSMSSTWQPESIPGMDKVDTLQRLGAAGIGNAGSVLGGIISKFPGLSSIGEAISNASAGVANKRIKPLELSYLAWIKSDTSPINFNLFRFALRPEDDVLESFRILSRMVLPTRYNDMVIQTPGGYTPPYMGGLEKLWDMLTNGFSGIFGEKKSFEEGTVAGTVTIHIGEWCTVRNLLVSSLSFTASKVCTRLGNPLYASGKIELLPYRMLLADDIENMMEGIKSGEIDDTPPNNDTYPPLFRR